jgi:GT2 family glycosyltransferase
MTSEHHFDLSVVIVNYNVANFLEQCLNSVFAASQNLRIEVFVVDNNSVDGSVTLVREKFPSVQLLANTDNVGFSKANNQAIHLSKGTLCFIAQPRYGCRARHLR